MPNNEVTTNEIMEFLRDNMVMREEFNQQKDDFNRALNKLKLEMLDAVDIKLINLKGDLITLMRSEDVKVDEFIKLLKKKKVIDSEEAKKLLSLAPFPHTI